jgi:hypothetical protein
MDLSLKGTFLPKELQEKQTPFDHYLRVRAACRGSPVYGLACLNIWKLLA